MPKPIVWNGKCYIDYACELQLVSRLQLNLYANGLNNIPEIFGDKSYKLGYLKAPGIVVVEKGLYEETEKTIKDSFQVFETSQRYTRMMYEILEKVKRLNNEIEKKIEYKNVKKVDVERLYYAVEKMMSMMIFQWLSFDYNLIIEDTGLRAHDVQMLAAPIMYEPYQIRELRAYMDALKDIRINRNTYAVKKYVNEYAFLKNFEIDRNEDEDVEKLISKLSVEDMQQYKNILQKYHERNIISERKRQRLYKDIFECVPKERLQRVQNNLLLMRICADEEEERHYQQARATRNFRTIMEMNELDIYIGIEDILNKI